MRGTSFVAALLVAAVLLFVDIAYLGTEYARKVHESAPSASPEAVPR